jgi:hypothetical protein
MINWLIKFLGGVLREDNALLIVEYNAQRDLVSSYRARVDYLEKELALEREERKSLQNIIYKKFGVIVPDEISQSQEELQPVRTSPRRWSDLKGALERDDRERVGVNSSGSMDKQNA